MQRQRNYIQDQDSDEYSDVSQTMEIDEEARSSEYDIGLRQLCDAVRRLDVEALHGANPDLRVHGGQALSQDTINAIISTMVREGNEPAIEMMIRELADVNDLKDIVGTAIFYYLELHLPDKADALVAKYTVHVSPDAYKILVVYYTKYCLVEKVEAFLQKYPGKINREIAQYKYARYGHFEQAESLLNRGGNLNSLVEGYARGRHYEKVNQWIEQCKFSLQRDNRKAAIKGFVDSRVFRKPEEILKMLSHINSNVTRALLMDHYKFRNRRNFPENLKTSVALNQSKRLNHIMREYQVDYEAAEFMQQALVYIGFRVWLLQGRQQGSLFSKLGKDVFIKIGAYVTNLPEMVVRNIYLAVSKNTHKGAHQLLLEKHSLFAENVPSSTKRNKLTKRRELEDAAAMLRDEQHDLDNRYDSNMQRIGILLDDRSKLRKC